MTIMKSEILSRPAEEKTPPVTLPDIERAAARIFGRVTRTPLVRSSSLSGLTGQPVHLKLETRQPVGAFKLRGAMNAILSLDVAARGRGLVTASTGNHGRAVAYAARELGLPATICMSSLVPANKIEAIRALGAEIRIIGTSQDDAQQEVERLVQSRGLTPIPPLTIWTWLPAKARSALKSLRNCPIWQLCLFLSLAAAWRAVLRLPSRL